MSIFQTPLQVAVSAFVVRNVLQWAKKKGITFNNIEIMVASFALNFLFTFFYGIGLAIYFHQPLSLPILQSFAGMILSALYHDLNSSGGTQMIFNAPAQPAPVAPTPVPPAPAPATDVPTTPDNALG